MLRDVGQGYQPTNGRHWKVALFLILKASVGAIEFVDDGLCEHYRQLNMKKVQPSHEFRTSYVKEDSIVGFYPSRSY